MKDQINHAMEKAISEGIFPAADLLVAKQGEVLHSKQYGDARAGTCFDIASLTKPVCTATLVMMLAEENLLKVSDTVYQWLGGARLPEHRLMTVEQLLNHTSGLPAWQPYYRELPLDLVGTEGGRHFILDACFHEPPIHQPGEKTLYSDIGYILLGEIVEQAGGASLDILFSNRIAKPLGLQDTFFAKAVGAPISMTARHGFTSADQHVPTPKYGRPEDRAARKENERRRFAPTEDCPWRERVIHGEVHDQNAYALGGVAGHAGLFSTAQDLYRFVLELTNCYKGKSDWIPQNTMHQFFNFENCRGQGIFIGGWDTPSSRNSASGRYFSKRSIGHLAYTGCSIWIDLEKDFSIVLLTNRIHPSTTNEKIKAFRPQIHDLIYKTIF
jgi:CubicO group peptidase (beta-lactamase class C family)